MPFSSGTFSLYTPGNPVVTGTTISSTWANNTLTDIASGLSNCVLKDGTQTITANITMSGFGFTNVASITGTSNVLAIPSRINISGSNGGQITFPAVQNASTDANTLDDYEESTWTPSVIGSTTPGTQTYTVQVGRYVKVGKTVTANAYVVLATIGATCSGFLRISGLPYASANISNFRQVASCGVSLVNLNVAGGYYSTLLYLDANATQLTVMEQGDNVTPAQMSPTTLQAGSEFYVSINYIADS